METREEGNRLKRDQTYLAFSLIATVALATRKVKREFNNYKFEQNIKQKIKGTKNILIIGDSVARGYGTTSGGIQKKLIEELSVHFENVQVCNKGVDGLTSKGLVEKIETEEFVMEIKKSHMIIINIGGNDLLVPFKEGGVKKTIKDFRKVRTGFGKNIRLIINTIKNLNPEVIIVMNTLYNSMDKQYSYYGLSNLLIGYWNSSAGIEGIIRVKTNSMKREKGYWIDLVHPDDKGYDEMGELICIQLIKYIK
jgi:lysophospholipase L1-like esterase